VLGARRAMTVVAVAIACSLGHASAAAACGGRPYAYAGVSGTTAVAGVGAEVATLAAPRVTAGHVAAFVGVGGPRTGATGSSAWIQIGLSGFAGGASSVYYEVARPGAAPLYTELKANVRPGEAHRIAVLEVRGRPGWWRVWLDGNAASAPVDLPGSHARWTPVATAESWNPGGSACNAYAYRFDRVSVAARPGGAWRQLFDHYAFSDPGYRIVPRSDTAFVATTSPGAGPRRDLVSVKR
jgi:hypothetical protein